MTRPAQRHEWCLHVGLPKTGTTYLQAVLAHHRDALREAGVLYPFVRPQAMFLGAVEVRGSREKFGLSAEDVAGAWAALCDRVRAHDGLSVISHEILGGAEPDEIAAALRPLAGVEVDVVVTARDLGRQATAHWQEEVKLGDVRSFADFEREQYRADVPPPRHPAALLARPGLRRRAAPLVHGRPGVAGAPGDVPAAGSPARRAVAAVRRRVRDPGRRRRPRRRTSREHLAEQRGDRPGAGREPRAGRAAEPARAREVRQARPGRGPAGGPGGYAASGARLAGRRARPRGDAPGAATWRRPDIPCTATWPTSIPCSERRGTPTPTTYPRASPTPPRSRRSCATSSAGWPPDA